MKTIIFEGIDKVGKTTAISNLYNKLKEDGMNPMMLNLPFTLETCHKSNQLSTFRLDKTLDTVLEMNTFFDDSYVLLVDRFHLSEWVYDSVLRNHQPINTFLLKRIDNNLRDIKVFLVYLTTSNVGKLYDEFKDENGLLDGLTGKQYLASHSAFEEIFSSSTLDKVKVGRNEIDMMTSLIMDYIKWGSNHNKTRFDQLDSWEDLLDAQRKDKK